jgi:hypothetical protein
MSLRPVNIACSRITFGPLQGWPPMAGSCAYGVSNGASAGRFRKPILLSQKGAGMTHCGGQGFGCGLAPGARISSSANTQDKS